MSDYERGLEAAANKAASMEGFDEWQIAEAIRALKSAPQATDGPAGLSRPSTEVQPAGAAHAELVKQLHDQLGNMIDQVGHPDYSLRELVDGLREVRDGLLKAADALTALPAAPTVPCVVVPRGFATASRLLRQWGSNASIEAADIIDHLLPDALRWKTLLQMIDADESDPVMNNLLESDDPKVWCRIIDRAMLAAAQSRPALTPLSAENKASRTPLSVEERLNQKHDGLIGAINP